MTEVQEIGIEIGNNTQLFKALLAQKNVLELIKLELKSNSPAEFEEDPGELKDELTAISVTQAQAIFRALPEHNKLQNLAGTVRGVNSYFFEFAEAIDKLAHKIVEIGSTDQDEILSALFPVEATPTEAINPVVISPVEDLAARIKDLIKDGKINLAAAREAVYGHEGFNAFPGEKLEEIIQEVTGGVEIIVDQHTQALEAIKAFVDEDTEIPEALLAYMKSKVPGGTTVGSYTTDKIVRLYLTNQTDKNQHLRKIQLLSNRDHERNGKSSEGPVAKTSAEHLQDVKTLLESKRASGQMVLAARYFSNSYKNFLSKNYSALVGLEARVKAHLASQGSGELLQGFTFESQSKVSQLSIDEIKAGKVALEKVLRSIQDSEDKQFGPSDLEDISELQFLRGQRARVTGSSFADRVRNFAKHTKQMHLLKGINILSTDADTVRTTDKRHLDTLEELIEGNAIRRASDIPEAVIGHLERHYRHKAKTTKERATQFLEAQGRADLAAKLGQLM